MEIIGLLSFFALIFFIVTSASSKIRLKISPKFSVKKSLLFCIISFALFIIAFSTTDSPTDTNEVVTVSNDVENTAPPEADISPTIEPVTTETIKPTIEPVPTETIEPTTTPEPTIKETTAQRNAVNAAIDYLNYTGFSRSGLIEQLEFEGYSTDDAEYAVDKLEVDWNAQAYTVAVSYLEYTSFSKQGLIDQLVFEGFTKEQAKYGAEKAYE